MTEHKETRMNQIDLAPETCAVLDRIRHSSRVLLTYDMPADLAGSAPAGNRVRPDATPELGR